MGLTVVVIGAQDEVGSRLCEDFARRGCRVLRGLLNHAADALSRLAPGQFSIDPASDTGVREAVNQLDCPVDLLVVNLDYRPEGSAEPIGRGQNYAALAAAYNYNTVGPIRIVQAFLPLLERGGEKRICVVTAAESSNNSCYDTANYLNHTTKAALNMGMQLLFNELRPKGYRFRLYCKSSGEPCESVERFAAEYFLRNRSFDSNSARHSDENRLVLRNQEGRELPW